MFCILNLLHAAVLNVVMAASVEATIDFLSFCINVVVSRSFAWVGFMVVAAVVVSAKYDAERKAFEAPRTDEFTIFETTFSASA